MLAYLNHYIQKPWIFAHRGASEEFPQNTVLAFDMAIKGGAIGIETDLRYTKDHEVICFHDRHLDRLSTLKGSVSQSTIGQIAKARVRHKKNTSQGIPTLAELLNWLPNETAMILELKDRQFENLKFVEAFINTLAKHNVIEKSILSSFSMARLKTAKKILPSINTCFITPYNYSPNIGADLIAPYYPILLWLNPNYIDIAHNMDKLVSVWDPHPENRIEYYLRKKVDILTSDNPAKLIKVISKFMTGKTKSE
jgi:glycerophosphoryl diester phosphodiesterase